MSWPVYNETDSPRSLTRKLMSRMLKRLGAEVVTAANGQDGLKLIVDSYEPGGRPFDVVFLDK